MPEVAGTVLLLGDAMLVEWQSRRNLRCPKHAELSSGQLSLNTLKLLRKGLPQSAVQRCQDRLWVALADISASERASATSDAISSSTMCA